MRLIGTANETGNHLAYNLHHAPSTEVGRSHEARRKRHWQSCKSGAHTQAEHRKARIP